MTGYGSGTLPIAVAHRGGAGIGRENTMEAFRRSTALGIRHLEFDIRLTRDRVPVLFHDQTLEAVTGMPTPITALTLEELSQVEVAPGLWVPTLADVLHGFATASLMIDIKDAAAMTPVLDIIDDFGATDRVCLTGGWDRHLRRARARFPGVHTNLGWGRMSMLLAGGHARLGASRLGSKATFVHLPYRLGRFQSYVPRLVGLAHDLDLRVMVWGVDEPSVMHRLLDDGVDGLITDRPDLLREVLISRDQWLPHQPASRPAIEPTRPVSEDAGRTGMSG
ncbi:glycerophosphodiester phosphodiesterase [soil metagenome]